MSSASRSFELKLDRADVHLGELRRLVERLRRDTVRALESEWDPVAGASVLRTGAVPDVDPSLPTVVGDVLHDLRSALDHLAYELSRRHAGGHPAAPGNIAFPIQDARDSWRFALALQHVAHDARGRIDELQPYRAGSAAAEHPLSVLRALSDVARHRSLHVLAIAMLDPTAPSRELPAEHVAVAPPGPLRPHRELARFRARAGARAGDAPAAGLDVSVHLVFSEGALVRHRCVLGVLEELRAHVRGVVVPALSPYLAP